MWVGAVLAVLATAALALLVDLTLSLQYAGICDVEPPTAGDLSAAKALAAWVCFLVAPWLLAVARSRHRRRTLGFALAAVLPVALLAQDAWSWSEATFRICLFTF